MELIYYQNTAFNSGVLDICVLAVIKGEDSYGYQIIKYIKPYVEISESTLYPILRRHEAAKLLTVRNAEHNGRLRKYYSITPSGLEKFNNDWQGILSIYNFVTRKVNYEKQNITLYL